MEAAEVYASQRGDVKGTDMRGTLRPLADSISVEQAERASKLVREAIDQLQRQLEELQRFSVENKSLFGLVLELPDSVSHQIMVPFGKAAFFDGRLKHTNEFLVFLGENHYAERSAKQTVEILDRRSHFLDRKIASTKAQIADLEAESRFVTNTAEEAKAGLVEIREEYLGSGKLDHQLSTTPITAAAAARDVDSVSRGGSGSYFGASTSSSGSVNADEDREHDLVMARLTELELAEAAAGMGSDSEEEGDDDSIAGASKPVMTDFRSREVSRKENDLSDYDSEDTEDEDSRLSNSDDEDDYVDDAPRGSKQDLETEDEEEDDNQTWRHGEKREQEAFKGKPISRFAREAYAKKGASDSQHSSQNMTFQQRSPSDEKRLAVASHSRPLEKPEGMQGHTDRQKEPQALRREGAQEKGRHADEGKIVGSSVSDRVRVPARVNVAGRQDFIGKVMEHTYAEPAIPNEEQPKVEEAAQESRPMSKFKMRQAQAGRR